MSLTFVQGDVLYPVGTGNKIIAHICNTVGAWGGGFTAPLTKRWIKPKLEYRSMQVRKLGTVQFVQVEENIVVANMIAQVFHRKAGPPIRYPALNIALYELATHAVERHASIHMPRIGTGLAGGDWFIIEQIIIEQLVKTGIHVFVYDLV